MKARYTMPLMAMLLSAALLPACKEEKSETSTAAAGSAAPIGLAECAACKMVVREQPAPRAQVIHRDGTRAHLCSIGDLVQYLQAPSPHGKPSAIWVEGLEAEFDPTASDTKERSFIEATSAHYVVGVKRERIMGPAVLAYASAEVAKSAAAKHGGTVNDWQQLQAYVLKK